VKATIPAGTYNGQTGEVQTAAVVNYLVTRSDMKDDTVYQMTKTLFESLPDLVAAHSAARAIKVEGALEGMPIPMHPGAERYLKEKGVTKQGS
jgi:TRAP transporter TAXI family solute receptor